MLRSTENTVTAEHATMIMIITVVLDMVTALLLSIWCSATSTGTTVLDYSLRLQSDISNPFLRSYSEACRVLGCA